MEEATFEIQTQERDGVPVIILKGYLDEDAATRIDSAIEGFHQKGKNGFVLDFSGCTNVNSLGASALLDMGVKISEEFQGKLLLAALPAYQNRVFSLMGIFQVAQPVATIEEGLLKLKS